MQTIFSQGLFRNLRQKIEKFELIPNCREDLPRSSIPSPPSWLRNFLKITINPINYNFWLLNYFNNFLKKNLNSNKLITHIFI